MHLYLIRHAQSANNELYARTGADLGRSADPPLTELGHRQAQHLARLLAAPAPSKTVAGAVSVIEFAERHDRGGFSLTHLYCSLMTRAIQTAGYISTATGLPIFGWPEVHERGGLHQIDKLTGEDMGVPGPNRAWFEAEFPNLVLPDVLDEAGWWNRPLETVLEAIPRARTVWTQFLERNHAPSDRIAIVSHAGFFQSLMTTLLSDDDELVAPHLGAARVGFGMSNTSISRIEFDERGIVIRYLNRVDFLPDELITG